MNKHDKYHESLNTAAEKYVSKHYYKNAWKTEKKTFLAGAKWVIRNPNWISINEKFPTPNDGHFFVLWEDGLPDIDGKFRVHELARYDRGIDDSRWVNVHSEFQIKFCPMCGDKI